ncbi:MAG: calcium/sodium antiporter [Flavobacteriales bacterium]|jgi:cation:H+ antiporter|nr:calcium/sodium antiporter [Flavobacteriales bacterium]
MNDWLLTLVGLAVLVVGAEGMVRGAVDLALRARISPLVVGLTVVSMGTSAPELLVSLFAAIKGSSVIAVGNVVGSNIVNITFILGACILVLPLEVDRDAHRIHWPVMMVSSLLFWGLLQNDAITRLEGLLFVLLLAGYIVWMIRRSRKETAAHETAAPARMPVWKAMLLLVVGIAGLAKGADWFVEGAVAISRGMGVSEQLIGVTVVAIGTSLPELVTSLVAAIRGQADIGLGNLVGSNVFNLLGIIGVSSAVFPIQADHTLFQLDVNAMLLSAALLYPLMRLGERLGRWQGAVLVLFYIGYVLLVLQRG